MTVSRTRKEKAMQESISSDTDRNVVEQLINNARRLAIGPVLELNELKDDPQARYFTSYTGDKIAVIERTDGGPLRTIAIFPSTSDGKIAAGRVCDSLNSKDGCVSIDESLSFEIKKEIAHGISQRLEKDSRGDPLNRQPSKDEELFGR